MVLHKMLSKRRCVFVGLKISFDLKSFAQILNNSFSVLNPSLAVLLFPLSFSLM
jgi:hypothetical protein